MRRTPASTQASNSARGVAVCTNVYLRTGDGWKMLMHHASPAPAAAAPRGAEAPKILH